jgi:hypothetical protein
MHHSQVGLAYWPRQVIVEAIPPSVCFDGVLLHPASRPIMATAPAIFRAFSLLIYLFEKVLRNAW